MGKGERRAGVLVALLAAGAALWWLGASVVGDERDGGGNKAVSQLGVAAPVEKQAPSAVADAASAQAALPEPLSPSAATNVAESTASSEPGTPLRLTGRVVDGDGRPVPEAIVRLLPSKRQIALMNVPFRPFESSLEIAQLVATKTGLDGTFVLDGRDVPPDDAAEQTGKPRSGSGISWPVLLVSHPDYEAAASTCLGWSGGPYAAGDIVLRFGASVTGRAVDDDGLPLAGVSVAPAPNFDRYDRPGDWEAVKTVLPTASGPDGRFRLDGLWAGKMVLQLRAPGRMCPVRQLTLTAGEVVDLGDVVLGRGRTIEGYVVDAGSGQPVPGARVLVRKPFDFWIFDGSDAMAYLFEITVGDGYVVSDRDTHADEQGFFRLTGLEDRALDVLAGAPGYEPMKQGTVEPGSEPLSIALMRAGAIVLTVVDPESGEPIEGATVAGRRHADEKEMAITKLDDISDPAALTALGIPEPHAGVHVLTPAGSYRNTAIVSAPGRATRGVILPTVIAPGRAAATVKLPREVGFGGRVLDDAGKPIAGAKVVLHAPEDLRVKLEDRVEKTGADGRFHFAGLMHGDWDATASARGFITSPSRLLKLRLATPVVEDEFVLQRGGTIAGVVLAAGAPAAGLDVQVHSLAVAQAARAAEAAGGGTAAVKDEPAVASWKAQSGTDGRFRIEGLPPDTYELTGPPGVRVELGVAAGETAEVTLLARGRPRVRGRVLDASGPVAGATVGAELLVGQWAGFLEGGGSATSGLDGSYDLEVSEPCGVRIGARHDGASTPSLEIELVWDDVKWVDLRFGGGALRGQVLAAATHEPVAGAKVRLLMKRAPRADAEPDFRPTGQEQVSDERGRFEFGRLSPGEYGLSLAAPGYVRPKMVTAKLSEGAAPPELRLELQSAGALRGVVKPAMPDAALPGELRVSLEWLDGPADRVSARVDAGGNFERDGLLPGRWRCEVRLSSMAPDVPALVSREVLVVVGETAEVKLTLPP